MRSCELASRVFRRLCAQQTDKTWFATRVAGGPADRRRPLSQPRTSHVRNVVISAPLGDIVDMDEVAVVVVACLVESSTRSWLTRGHRAPAMSRRRRGSRHHAVRPSEPGLESPLECVRNAGRGPAGRHHHERRRFHARRDVRRQTPPQGSALAQSMRRCLPRVRATAPTEPSGIECQVVPAALSSDSGPTAAIPLRPGRASRAAPRRTVAREHRH
jgi:hypothetical protein